MFTVRLCNTVESLNNGHSRKQPVLSIIQRRTLHRGSYLVIMVSPISVFTIVHCREMSVIWSVH